MLTSGVFIIEVVRTSGRFAEDRGIKEYRIALRIEEVAGSISALWRSAITYEIYGRHK